MTEEGKYNCVVIDDEYLARKLMADYISKIPQFNLVASFDTPMAAINTISKGEIDVIFTDIEMPDMSGMDFIKNLTFPSSPLIVFVTAYPQYAVQGFEVNAVEYLLKPVSFPRFIKAVNKITTILNYRQRLKTVELPQKANSAEPLSKNEDKNFILVKSERKIVKLLYKDILFIEGALEYVIFHSTSSKYMGLFSLKKLEKELPSDQFMRIHKSYIVALDKISEINGNMVKVGGQSIPVSKTMKPVLMNYFSGEEHSL
ncbi:LytR/AlgR family response regulator transcription factor [Thermophagus xiamenensis]|uniref:Two component transcriptional regulator, LytTR family n=1 Tax=Thermophagus xiamenensis TaxID=385682 RepID=A0A1I1ZV28_9BACT|nr:LytTR family DNA-binding domain-containing protein [Thermophagus xiamenensis]SFE35482.1 two component transcriptional regulator, LytTR family [Thermophagus xiamenensis]